MDADAAWSDVRLDRARPDGAADGTAEAVGPDETLVVPLAKVSF